MNLFKNWAKSFLTPFVLLKYNSIWDLKRHLTEHHKQSGLAAACYSHYVEQRGSYIGIDAVIGGTPYLPHGLSGIFISDGSSIGKNAVIFQQVTIGAVRTKGSKHPGNPVIGDNCYIGAGAKIIGGIRIGDNCRIGANAVVCEDMPDNSIAVCSPTKIIRRDTVPDNRFYVLRPRGGMEVFENGSFHPADDDA